MDEFRCLTKVIALDSIIFGLFHVPLVQAGWQGSSGSSSGERGRELRLQLIKTTGSASNMLLSAHESKSPKSRSSAPFSYCFCFRWWFEEMPLQISIAVLFSLTDTRWK